MASPSRVNEILAATLPALSGSSPDVEAAVQAILALRPSAAEIAEAQARHLQLRDEPQLAASMIARVHRLQEKALALASERSSE
jgi:Tfp pilus assembly protein PilN